MKINMSVIKGNNLPIPAHRPASVFNGCGQACVQMIINHFEKQDLEIDDLNTICGISENGAFSGMFDMAMGMADQGYQVIRVADIKPQDYLLDPVKYMKAVGFDPTNFPDIIQARKNSVSRYIEYVEKGVIKEHSQPVSIEIMRDFIEKGYGLISWVNCTAIAGDFNKTVGHYVVPIDVNKTELFYHDPGELTEEYGVRYAVSAKTTHDLFLQYMRYPREVGLNQFTNKPPMMGILALKK